MHANRLTKHLPLLFVARVLALFAALVFATETMATVGAACNAVSNPCSGEGATETCFSSTCVALCSSDADCSFGEVCDSNLTGDPSLTICEVSGGGGGGGGGCFTDTDCAFGETCDIFTNTCAAAGGGGGGGFPTCGLGEWVLAGPISSCEPCDPGTYQDEPSHSYFFCKDADPGFYVGTSNASNQTACPAGTYTDQIAQTACATPSTVCPAGQTKTADATSTSDITCSPVSPGFWNDGTKLVQEAWTTCPSGYSETTPGTDISDRVCTAAPSCTAGQELSGGICVDCTAGSYSTDGTQCIAAPTGSYAIGSGSGGAGATGATLCPAGKYTDQTGQSSCVDAPTGSYATGPGATGSVLCAAGQYAEQIGQSACTDAPTGSYASGPGAGGAGATGFTSCTLGSTYQNLTGKSSCNAVTACTGAETETTAPTLTSDRVCSAPLSCTAGQAPSGGACVACAAGSYSTDGTQCIAAPTGSYAIGSGSGGAGATGATLCPAGKYTDQVGQSSCAACSLGYTSALGASACEDIDECVTTPSVCGNHSQCGNTQGGFVCACAPGFAGTFCDECAPGYFGANCDPVPNCNNGQASDGITGSGECVCQTGFDGDHCQNNINDCAITGTNPCQNNGFCVDGVNSVTCECMEGFDGDYCQNNINECAVSNPCQNGSICVDGVNNAFCVCSSGFGGDHCQNNIDDCAPNPCQNNGTCVDGVNDFTCSCPAGFTGALCNEPDTSFPDGTVCDDGNEYTSDDVITGGICKGTPLPDGTVCDDDNEYTLNDVITDGICQGTCADGFTGDLCDQVIRPNIFVTSTTYTGDLGGVAGADAKCQAAADASDKVSGTFMALLSGINPEENVVTRINKVLNGQPGGPYYNTNDELVADNFADLYDEDDLVNAIGYDEKGSADEHRLTWTNTNADGTTNTISSSTSCENFSSSSLDLAGLVGDSSATSLSGGSGSCDDKNSLYCIEVPTADTSTPDLLLAISDKLFSLDSGTGDIQKLADINSGGIIAVQPVTNLVYLAPLGSSPPQLQSYDVDIGETTFIPITFDPDMAEFQGLAFSPAAAEPGRYLYGSVYFATQDENGIYSYRHGIIRIDLETNTVGDLVQFGNEFTTGGDLAFDESGTLYAQMNINTTSDASETGFYKITDLETGDRTNIGGDGDEGLAFVGNTLFGASISPSLEGGVALYMIALPDGSKQKVADIDLSAWSIEARDGIGLAPLRGIVVGSSGTSEGQYTACDNKTGGDVCSFTSNDESASGVCQTDSTNNKLYCAANDGDTAVTAVTISASPLTAGSAATVTVEFTPPTDLVATDTITVNVTDFVVAAGVITITPGTGFALTTSASLTGTATATSVIITLGAGQSLTAGEQATFTFPVINPAAPKTIAKAGLTLKTSGQTTAIASSADIVITAPTTVIAITRQPSAIAEVGKAFAIQPVVTFYRDGAVDTARTLTVALTLEDATTGKLTGTASIAAVAGVATFSGLRIDQPGTYTLVAAATGYTSVPSLPITVQAAVTTTALAFSGTVPTTVVAGEALALTVKATDATLTAVNTEQTGSVTLSVATDPTALRGLATTSFLGGFATFTDLSFTKAGTFKLTATYTAATGGTPAFLAAITTIDIVVTAAKPVANNPSQEVTACEFVEIDSSELIYRPNGIDLTFNGLQVELVQPAEGETPNGTPTIQGSKVTYRPTPGFTGEDSFSYRLSDAAGRQAVPPQYSEGKVTVTVVSPFAEEQEPGLLKPKNMKATGLINPVPRGFAPMLTDGARGKWKIDWGLVNATDMTKEPGKVTSFSTGKHTIRWTATNSSACTVTADQPLLVHPQVTPFTKATKVRPGASAEIEFKLTGEAPQYPVAVPFQFAYTCGDIGEARCNESPELSISHFRVQEDGTKTKIQLDGSGGPEPGIIYSSAVQANYVAELPDDVSTTADSFSISLLDEDKPDGSNGQKVFCTSCDANAGDYTLYNYEQTSIEFDIGLAPPSGGSISASPSNLEALATVVTLDASGWQTAPSLFPLIYTFYYKEPHRKGDTSSTKTRHVLGTASTKSVVRVTLPAGSWDVCVDVADNEGNSTSSCAQLAASDKTLAEQLKKCTDTTKDADTGETYSLEECLVDRDEDHIPDVIEIKITTTFKIDLSIWLTSKSEYDADYIQALASTLGVSTSQFVKVTDVAGYPVDNSMSRSQRMSINSASPADQLVRSADRLTEQLAGVPLLLTTDTGHRLALGGTAMGTFEFTPLLSPDRLSGDAGFVNVGGVFDFVVSGGEASDSYRVVIPQLSPIPAYAVYRKLATYSETWFDFVEDDRNTLWSAPGAPGICPSPADSSWQSGLSEGHWCVRLVIEDGGPNDDDGEVNARVSDPGGVAVLDTGNSWPQAENDTLVARLNLTSALDLLANDNDPDGDILTVMSAEAVLGEVSVTDSEVLYTPPTDLLGEDSLTYVISDGKGGTDFASAAITVQLNQAPTAVDDRIAANSEVALTIDVLANDTDPEDDALTIVSAVSNHGTVTIGAGHLVYVSITDFSGVDTITYTIADAFGETATAQVRVNVTALAMATNRSSGGGGGGCSVNIGRGDVDPLFYLMLLAAFGYLARRSRNGRTSNKFDCN